MIWAASHGDRLGVTGCSTLGGGNTLGGVAVGDITGFGSDGPLGCGKANGVWIICVVLVLQSLLFVLVSCGSIADKGVHVEVCDLGLEWYTPKSGVW